MEFVFILHPTMKITMKANYTISIPKPCDQKWSDFKPTSTGGHCASCDKVVVDFTSMSDDQILTYLKRRSKGMCGRFRSDQLKSYADVGNIKPGFRLFSVGMIGLLGAISHLAVGQPTIVEQAIVVEAAQAKSDRNNMASAHVSKRGIIVKGIITAEQSPLPGANVVLKGSQISTVTDFEGRFEFVKELQPGDVLIVSFIGYEDEEIKIQNTVDKMDVVLQLNVALEMDEMTVLGKLAVAGRYTEDQNVFQRVWTRITEIF